MKLPLLLFSLTLLFFAGCTTPQRGVTPGSRDMVHDVDIRLATFGTGLHVADVTGCVIRLLRENEAGFSPTDNTLGVDPLPYTPKALVIDYYYQGKPYRFAVVGQQHVSYEMLVENAEQ